MNDKFWTDGGIDMREITSMEIYRWQWMVYYHWVSSWGLKCWGWFPVEPLLFDPVTNELLAWARPLTWAPDEFVVDGPSAAGALTYVR